MGTWYRGILHGKRIETKMNLKVFPKGYYSQTHKDVKSVHFVQEMKKGVANGPASLFINEKRVCRTQFSDKIEIIKSKNHPVGKANLMSTDRAALNCILVLVSAICFLLVSVLPEQSSFWVIIGGVLYLVQLVEVFLSQTTSLLLGQSAWDDLELFRFWFYELKKSRPKLSFSFTPTKDQDAILCELYTAEQTLAQTYKELKRLRTQSNK